MITIGLTGGIGSGKTTVSNLFSGLGISIVDADVVAREVVEPGTEALTAIEAHFSAAVINTDGTLNRQALRQRVFEKDVERLWLEALLHPLIRQRIQEQLEISLTPYTILSSPLLLETDQHQLVDRVLVIDIPEELQLERACARDENSREQIKAIMAAQMNRQTRCARADDIILNDSSAEELKAKVLTLHQRYLKLSEEFKQ